MLDAAATFGAVAVLGVAAEIVSAFRAAAALSPVIFFWKILHSRGMFQILHHQNLMILALGHRDISFGKMFPRKTPFARRRRKFFQRKTID